MTADPITIPGRSLLWRLGLLQLAAGLYGLAVRVRNLAVLVPGVRYRSRLPVISVGNITVGGTGKTPLVRELVRILIGLGERPVILLRGYGGSARGPLVAGPSHTASQIGDEARMLLVSAGVPVVVSRRRVSGAVLIEKQALGTVIVLDDGFQHRWLRRDLDIVCIDGSSERSAGQLSSGRLLPHGVLREPLIPALQRADLFLINARNFTGLPREVLDKLLKLLPEEKPTITSTVDSLRVSGNNGVGELQPQAIVALSGIGNPEAYHATLIQAGFTLRDTVVLRDHQPIDPDTLKTALRIGVPVVLTEKDAARLGSPLPANVWVASISLCLKGEELLIERVREGIAKCRSEAKG
jgi:tetraacyldisaccharide 4'-kinase